MLASLRVHQTIVGDAYAVLGLLSAQGGGSGSTLKPIGSQMTNLPDGNNHSDRGRYDD